MVSKLGEGTSLGSREKMWLRVCRIVSGIKAWESHRFTGTALTKPVSPVYKEHKVGNTKIWGQGAGEIVQSESTCCASIKGPEFDPQSPSKKIGTFVIPAQGR